MVFHIENNILKKYIPDGDVKEVVVPEGVKFIGDMAFSLCYMIESVRLPESVNGIGSRAFEKCYNLKNINIPENVGSIGEGAFYLCKSLEKIVLPEKIKTISGYTFWRCSNLKSVVFSYGLESIEESAFYECVSLADVKMPDSVISIGKKAFWKCGIVNLKLSENVRTIQQNAFLGNRIRNIVLPDNVETVEDSAFRRCINNESLSISENIKTIMYTSPTDNTYLIIRCENVPVIPIKINRSISAYYRYFYVLMDFLKADIEVKENIFRYFKRCDYKFFCAVYLLFRHNSENAEKYIKKHIIGAVEYFIDRENIEAVKSLLIFIDEDNINMLIEYAIKRKKYEIQIMLSKYKGEKFGFDSDFSKYEL